MKVYTVHINPGQADPIENAVLVREGFNFWAFLLTGLWALFHRQWLAFIGLLVVSGLVNLAIHLANGGPEMDFLLNIVVSIGFGLVANDLRRRKLAKQGWKMVEIIASHSEQDALHQYVHRAVKNTAITPTPVSSYYGSNPTP
ncbi:DUF2628 domain-containing protein [Thalassospira sp. TSL5-1]|uniref:DUF2628 domain-containing protein n=1 Tax=Thalassospira sp. TSL5-1 TaxID=1544451 RepID=UPI00093EFEC3|nr:DUF2628 domain-containing protein [Thalassospira sp. TSL5-1]OKH87321.1 hypothetical protein LF95_10855 [Thalassospira sp. TSL5-1]